MALQAVAQHVDSTEGQKAYADWVATVGGPLYAHGAYGILQWLLVTENDAQKAAVSNKAGTGALHSSNVYNKFRKTLMPCMKHTFIEDVTLIPAAEPLNQLEDRKATRACRIKRLVSI